MNRFTALHLAYENGRTWTLIADFAYFSEDLGIIRVPMGFQTDFASIPWGLWNLFPPSGPWARAAVIHDFLYRKSGVTRAVADKVFLDAMKHLGVNWLTRHLIYRAVRIFGDCAYCPA
jgi:hypothetical protein